MRRHRTLYDKLCSDGVIDHSNYDNLDEIPTSAIPHLTLPVSDPATDDSVDWKLKYESLKRDVDMSPRPSHTSPTHMDWKSMYTSIAEENETLRAKLGRFGLPTECSPEEDYVHLGTQYDIAIHENEVLRAQVRACENDQMAAQSAARETAAREYRLTILDSTDESLCEQVDGVGICDTSGSSVVSQDGNVLVEGDVSESRGSLHEMHARLVSDHETLKERCCELMKTCEVLTGEHTKTDLASPKAEMEMNVGLDDSREEPEGKQLRQEVDSLRRQLDVATEEQQSRDVRYGTLLEEHTALVDSNKLLVERLKQTEHVGSTLSAEGKTGEATHVQTSASPVEASYNRDSSDRHMKEVDGKQQSVDETASLEDYKALMATHEALKEEFQTAQSKAKRDYTKMKAKAVAATRLAEQLKEQLSATENVSEPASDVAEQLEDYVKRCVVLTEKYQQSQQDVGALKEEQYHYGEDVRSLTEQRDRCVDDVEEQKVTIDSLGQKNVHLQEKVVDATARFEELEALRQTERALLVEDMEEQKITTDSLDQTNVNLQGEVSEATARIEELEALRQTERASLVEDVEEQKITIDSLGQKNVDLQEKVTVATVRIEELEALRQTEQYHYTEDVKSLTEQRDRCVEDVGEQKVTIDSLGHKNVHLQEEVADATVRIEELVALGQAERATLVVDLEEQKVTIDSLGQKNVDLQEKVAEATARIDEFEALRNTEQYQFTEDVRSLTEQRDRCVEDVEELKVTIDSLGQQNVQLQENAADAKANIEELEALRQMERASLVVDLEERRFTIDSLGQKNVDLQGNVTDANARIEELEALWLTEHAALVEENSKLRAAAVDRQSGDEETAIERKRYDEIDEEMITLRAKYDGQETEMQQLQRARVETDYQERQELESTRTELESTKGELASATAAKESSKSELDSTKVELESTTTELVSTKGELESTTTELVSTKGELESTTTELVSTKGELESTTTELVSTKGELESTTTELVSTKGELVSTKGELESTTTELVSTKGELESTTTELVSTKGELESTTTELVSTKGELESTTTELVSTKGELESTTTELVSTKGELESTTTELVSTKGELESTTTELVSTKGELESTTTELVSTKGELESTTTELVSTKGELESTTTELVSTKGELESTTTELMSTKGELESTTTELVSTKGELESTATELVYTKGELESTTADVKSTKQELESTRTEVVSTKGELESTKADVQSSMTELECIKTEMSSSKAELESTKTDIGVTKAELVSNQEVLESTKQELTSTKAEVNSSKAKLDSIQVELESMNARLESTQTELVKLQEEHTAHVAVKNRPTETEHLQTSVRTEDGATNEERQRYVDDTSQQVPTQTENNNLRSGSDDQLAKVTQDLSDMTRQWDNVSQYNETICKKNETVCKENQTLGRDNETLRGENESLRSQLIEITDKVEKQVERMQSAYAAVVEENDTNLVDVKRLTTQLSATEARCDQLQAQVAGETNETAPDENRQLSEELTRVVDLRRSDQASLVEMEAKYKTLSEEHKALCAESSSRQREVQRLEERLRSSAVELEEREKADVVVEENDNNLVDVKHLTTQLSAAEARCDQLQAQSDQTSLVQMEAKYDVLSEEYKAIHAESSSRQKEVQRLEERLRSTTDELKEREKEMAVVSEERATEREWFDLELQDWQSRYDAVHQESRQLKKVLSSGASSDTLATELLGLQHRYEEIFNERRLLQRAVNEHKTCVVAAEARVIELEARVEQLLLESPEVEASPVSLGDISVESVRLHVVDDGKSSSADRVDLGGVDPGDHSQIGVTSDVCRPSNLAPCFDAFSNSLSRSVVSIDTGGSSVTTDDVRSDVADSDASWDNTCDSLTQTVDMVTQKGAGDNSVRGSVHSSQTKPRRESEISTTKNASSRRQTALTRPSLDKTGRKGMVKKPATPKVRQPGTGETKRDKSVTTQESLGVKTATKSPSNVSSLKLDNDKLRREYQKLCEKMKRSTVKAGEDLAKMKRMYESAVKEKTEVKPKTPAQKPGQKTTKVETEPHKDTDSRRLRSDKTCSKEPNKLKKDMSGHRGQLGKEDIRVTANRGRDTTSEQHSGPRHGDWPLMVCVQCEILLAEKTDLCLKFDSERSQLKEEVEELSVRLTLSQSDDAAMLARKNKVLVEQLRSLRSELRQDSEERGSPIAGRHQLEQLSRQLNDVVVVNEALKQEASDLRRQLDATHKSPQRQPGDGSSHVTTSNSLLTRMPFVQRSNPDVSNSSGSMRSFGDDFGLSPGRRMADIHQSMTLLSHAELLLQYEILLQEKMELCVRLDEKIAEIEALTEKQNEPLVVDDKNREPDRMTRDNGQQLKQGIAECHAQNESFQMDQVENEKLTQDVSGLRQQLDQSLCDRHQLESKLEDLTFKNDELVSILETCESPESKGNSVELGSGDIGGARLEACEQQWGTLSPEKCSLMKELERCKKEMLISEQPKTNLGTKQDALQTHVSTQDAELTMSNLLPPEGAGDLSVEVGRLTREVEKWRQLNSDLCRVCQCFDDRVVSLSAELDQLSVINSDLRAENAVLVFEREDWTSGSEDVTEHRGMDMGQETGKDYKHQQYDNAKTVKDGGEFGHEERASDFTRLVHAVEQTELLEGDVMQKVGDTAAPVERSQSEVVKKSGESSCDEAKDIDDKSHWESLREPMTATEDMGLVSRECQLKDEYIKRLEMQLSRQQCDIQRAALEYKLMISLLSEVTLEQQGPDADTQGQSDKSMSTCLVDGLTVTSIAGLQHGDTVPTECGESLEETATYEMMKHEVERFEMEISRLTTENVSLSDRCREQEAIIAQLRHTSCLSDARESADEQVVSLVKQRDELRHQVEALKAELRKYVSVEAKFAAERSRCEQLRSKMEQLEQELLQERVALGRHIREQHRLVNLLHQGAGAREGGTVDDVGDRKDSGKSNREEDQVHKSRRVQKKDVLWRRAVDGGCGRKVRLKCGCSVEVGGRKMHVHCEYHRAIERLRVALAHTDARRHKHVIPAIPPH